MVVVVVVMVVDGGKLSRVQVRTEENGIDGSGGGRKHEIEMERERRVNFKRNI